MLLHSLSRAWQDNVREGCPPIEEARAFWLDDLLLSGKSALTARNYRICTRALTALTPEAARATILPYVGSNTARVVWAALRSLSTYAVQRGWVSADFMAGVPRPRERERPHRYLSTDELRLVYAACQDDRERLTVRLLLTGVRAAEFLQIAPELVQGGAIRIKGKGGRYRLIPLDDETLALLNQVGVPVPKGGYRQLHRVVGRIGERAGVAGLHPHLFRHTFGSHWMLEVGDTLTLQQLGGWRNPEMIRERYAKSAMEAAALKRAREANLTTKLLG